MPPGMIPHNVMPPHYGPPVGAMMGHMGHVGPPFMGSG